MTPPGDPFYTHCDVCEKAIVVDLDDYDDESWFCSPECIAVECAKLDAEIAAMRAEFEAEVAAAVAVAIDEDDIPY